MIDPRWFARAYYAVYPLALVATWSARDARACLPLVLLSLPAAAVVAGLCRMRRAAYFALQAHATLLFVTALLTVKIEPHTLAPALALAVLALAIAISFLRKDARIPYFSAERRGFRRHPRFELRLRATVVRGDDRFTTVTHDVSLGGAYLLAKPADLRTGAVALGRRVSLELSGRDGAALWVSATVQGQWPNGCGKKPPGVSVAFASPSASARRALRGLFAQARQHQRFAVRLPARVSHNGRTLFGETFDLSLGGCYFSGEASAVGMGEVLTLSLELDPGESIELLAELVWRRQVAQHGKPSGFALRFLEPNLHQARLQRFLATLERGERLEETVRAS